MIRDKSAQDEPWIRVLLSERWGGTIVVVHRDSIDAMALPALVAGDRHGLATYCLRGADAVLVTLLARRLKEQGIHRLWVTTTNDNLAALGFYQKRGFRLERLRAGAVEQSRLVKPGIPMLAANGIAIRDEIDLCRKL
jgi:RimJ/RimL family protein N-acetyltransferase